MTSLGLLSLSGTSKRAVAPTSPAVSIAVTRRKTLSGRRQWPKQLVGRGSKRRRHRACAGGRVTGRSGWFWTDFPCHRRPRRKERRGLFPHWTQSETLCRAAQMPIRAEVHPLRSHLPKVEFNTEEFINALPLFPREPKPSRGGPHCRCWVSRPWHAGRGSPLLPTSETGQA